MGGIYFGGGDDELSQPGLSDDWSSAYDVVPQLILGGACSNGPVTQQYSHPKK